MLVFSVLKSITHSFPAKDVSNSPTIFITSIASTHPIMPGVIPITALEGEAIFRIEFSSG